MTLFNKNEQSKNTQNEQSETLGKRIADRRKKHNLTQEEFSVLLFRIPEIDILRFLIW